MVEKIENMKIKVIYLALVFAMFVGSCSSDEDTAPSGLEGVNKFAPKDDDLSAEASMRRDFFKETGSYLLFNDTLSVVKTGEDAYGQPIYKEETIDLPFSFIGTGTSDYEYTYDYITDDAEKLKASNFVKDKLLLKLGKLCPYSVLVVRSISMWETLSDGSKVLVDEDSYYGTEPHPKYYLGSRCYAFSMDNGEAYSDEAYFDGILSKIIYDRVKAKGDTFIEDFTGLVSKYDGIVGGDKEELGYEYGRNYELANSLGFIKDGYYYFVKADEDLKSYVEAICTTSLEDFESQYSKYPICVQRFKVLRDKILSMGVQLD